jgi:hypothetical protein
MQFTRISKPQVLFKLPLCGQTLDTFDSYAEALTLQLAPWRERNLTLQCHPYGGGQRGWSKIPAMRRRSPVGEGRGRVYGRQGLGFGGWWAVGGDRCAVHRQPAAATAAGRAAVQLALAGAGKGVAGKERRGVGM